MKKKLLSKIVGATMLAGTAGVTIGATTATGVISQNNKRMLADAVNAEAEGFKDQSAYLDDHKRWDAENFSKLAADNEVVGNFQNENSSNLNIHNFYNWDTSKFGKIQSIVHLDDGGIVAITGDDYDTIVHITKDGIINKIPNTELILSLSSDTNNLENDIFGFSVKQASIYKLKWESTNSALIVQRFGGFNTENFLSNDISITPDVHNSQSDTYGLWIMDKTKKRIYHTSPDNDIDYDYAYSGEDNFTTFKTINNYLFVGTTQGNLITLNTGQTANIQKAFDESVSSIFVDNNDSSIANVFVGSSNGQIKESKVNQIFVNFAQGDEESNLPTLGSTILGITCSDALTLTFIAKKDNEYTTYHISKENTDGSPFMDVEKVSLNNPIIESSKTSSLEPIQYLKEDGSFVSSEYLFGFENGLILSLFNSVKYSFTSEYSLSFPDVTEFPTGTEDLFHRSLEYINATKASIDYLYGVILNYSKKILGIESLAYSATGKMMHNENIDLNTRILNANKISRNTTSEINKIKRIIFNINSEINNLTNKVYVTKYFLMNAPIVHVDDSVITNLNNSYEHIKSVNVNIQNLNNESWNISKERSYSIGQLLNQISEEENLKTIETSSLVDVSNKVFQSPLDGADNFNGLSQKLKDINNLNGGAVNEKDSMLKYIQDNISSLGWYFSKLNLGSIRQDATANPLLNQIYDNIHFTRMGSELGYTLSYNKTITKNISISLMPEKTESGLITRLSGYVPYVNSDAARPRNTVAWFYVKATNGYTFKDGDKTVDHIIIPKIVTNDTVKSNDPNIKTPSGLSDFYSWGDGQRMLYSALSITNSQDDNLALNLEELKLPSGMTAEVKDLTVETSDSETKIQKYVEFKEMSKYGVFETRRVPINLEWVRKNNTDYVPAHIEKSNYNFEGFSQSLLETHTPTYEQEWDMLSDEKKSKVPEAEYVSDLQAASAMGRGIHFDPASSNINWIIKLQSNPESFYDVLTKDSQYWSAKNDVKVQAEESKLNIFLSGLSTITGQNLPGADISLMNLELDFLGAIPLDEVASVLADMDDSFTAISSSFSLTNAIRSETKSVLTSIKNSFKILVQGAKSTLNEEDATDSDLFSIFSSSEDTLNKMVTVDDLETWDNDFSEITQNSVEENKIITSDIASLYNAQSDTSISLGQSPDFGLTSNIIEDNSSSEEIEIMKMDNANSEVIDHLSSVLTENKDMTDEDLLKALEGIEGAVGGKDLPVNDGPKEWITQEPHDIPSSQLQPSGNYGLMGGAPTVTVPTNPTSEEINAFTENVGKLKHVLKIQSPTWNRGLFTSIENLSEAVLKTFLNKGESNWAQVFKEYIAEVGPISRESATKIKSILQAQINQVQSGIRALTYLSDTEMLYEVLSSMNSDYQKLLDEFSMGRLINSTGYVSENYVGSEEATVNAWYKLAEEINKEEMPSYASKLELGTGAKPYEVINGYGKVEPTLTDMRMFYKKYVLFLEMSSATVPDDSLLDSFWKTFTPGFTKQDFLGISQLMNGVVDQSTENLWTKIDDAGLSIINLLPANDATMGDIKEILDENLVDVSLEKWTT